MREWTGSGRARFVAADLVAPGLPDRSFDVSISLRLLPHVRACRSWWRVGRVARTAVVVDYPTRRSVNAVAGLFFGLKQGVEGDTRPFRVFSDGEIEEAFAAHGFRHGASPAVLLPDGAPPRARARPGSRAASRARRKRSASRVRSAPPSC